MNPDFDVLIIGSGPAGVSAAFPLAASGLRVMMVDGGRQAGNVAPPLDAYLSSRYVDDEQWKWLVGKDFHTLREGLGASPKLRTATLGYVFEGFGEANRIITDNFVAVGSLATGGLSNAWGCGVVKLSAQELAPYPFQSSALERSYEIVSKRIGVSGRNDDDLAVYCGVDAWAQPPIPLDELNSSLAQRYALIKDKLAKPGFRLGKSRSAVLSEDFAGRRACNLSGNCLWGCHRQALYSSTHDLPMLRRHGNFHETRGFVATGMTRRDGYWAVHGTIAGTRDSVSITSRKVLMAAGTLASTRLVLMALQHKAPVPVLSSPTAAFLLWLPRFLGTGRSGAFGLGQLSFTFPLQDELAAFGSTLVTTGIPMAEFIGYLPLRRRIGIDFLREVMSSCLIGNLFLPGSLSTTKAWLREDEALMIRGGFSDEIPTLMVEASQTIRRVFRQLGAVMVPGSFTLGKPGADIHYAGTLPMRKAPDKGETDSNGEVAGLNGVHVVDGACLPVLSEKPHTLTVMANADRIGRAISASFGR